jgi:hypothetical protein
VLICLCVCGTEPFQAILEWTETPMLDTTFETLKPSDVRWFCDNEASTSHSLNATGEVGS